VCTVHLPIAGQLSWEKPPWGAKLRIELGPALQQANELPFEQHRTLTELRRTLTELRRTLTDIRRTLH
jgi:hypothetical protein